MRLITMRDAQTEADDPAGPWYPIIDGKITRRYVKFEMPDPSEPTTLVVEECTAENPCCDRRNEYNGYHSGRLIFACPKRCACHD